MSNTFFASLGALAVIAVGPLAAQPTSSAAKPAPSSKKAWSVPRLPDNHPDLQGIWTNATITPVERPSQFASKPTVTDAEAAVFEKGLNSNTYGDARSNNPE